MDVGPFMASDLLGAQNHVTCGNTWSLDRVCSVNDAKHHCSSLGIEDQLETEVKSDTKVCQKLPRISSKTQSFHLFASSMPSARVPTLASIA